MANNLKSTGVVFESNNIRRNFYLLPHLAKLGFVKHGLPSKITAHFRFCLFRQAALLLFAGGLGVLLGPVATVASPLPLETPFADSYQPSTLSSLAQQQVSQVCSWEQRIFGIIQRLSPGTVVLEDSSNNGSFSLHLLPATAGARLTLSILDSPQANAYALPATDSRSASVVLTQGLLSLIESENELAFVLAHEFAHIEKSHYPVDVPTMLLNQKQLAHIAKVHQHWELIADQRAVEQLTAAGFDCSASIALLTRLEKNFGHHRHLLFQQHPSPRHRLRALRENISRSTLALLNSEHAQSAAFPFEASYARR